MYAPGEAGGQGNIVRRGRYGYRRAGTHAGRQLYRLIADDDDGMHARRGLFVWHEGALGSDLHLGRQLYLFARRDGQRVAVVNPQVFVAIGNQ